MGLRLIFNSKFLFSESNIITKNPKLKLAALFSGGKDRSLSRDAETHSENISLNAGSEKDVVLYGMRQLESIQR